jgi:hypothetical protein
MRSKRSRFARMGILALALGVTVGMLGGAAEAVAAKKTLNMKTGVVPDAVDDTGAPPGANGTGQLGIFSSCKKIGTKASAKIKDTTFELSFTSADTSEIQVLAAGPKGGIELMGFEGNTPPPFPPNTVVGPTTFKDDAPLDIDDHQSTGDGAGFEGAGAEAFAPYAGEFRPESGQLSSLGSRTGGTWCIFAFDAFGPVFGAGPGDPNGIATITEAKFKFKTKG